MRKLVTTHVCPPIPDRRNDWCAHYDGDEESGDIGWGATEAEAIADFRDNYQDEADLRLDGQCACPYCFESSGYVWEHGNDWESGPWSHQTNIPCGHCNGTGVYEEPAPAAPPERPDDEVAF